MTIGQLARMFGLSRGTMLHYDAIGLLRPSMRSDAKYRMYSAADAERLRQICLYRSAGMPLTDIQRILDSPAPRGYISILRNRMTALSEEIALLHRQQQLIVRLLAQHGFKEEKEEMLNKEQFVALMRATGLNDDDMHRWHREFEKMSGVAHEDFLVSLGIDPKEIAEIRKWSKLPA
jgi:MerR family transcriptional regulator, thiopeptide resistance regulator